MNNNPRKKTITFVTDFDGTISDDDFFEYVKNAYFDDNALEPWRLYRKGELSHFEALKQMYGALRVSEDEIKELIGKVRIDEWVIPTFKLCHEADVPIYITSAGCDYYIKLLIGDVIEKYNIKLITNHSTYTQSQGLLMEKPSKDSPFYDDNVGISKAAIVKVLRDRGEFVIFAGDGPPDIEPARISDVVFAKKILLEKCIEQNIKTETFNDYKDIYLYLESELR